MRFKALVVDDEAAMRRLLVAMVRGMGDVEILEADDGTDALMKLEANPHFRPDVAVVDLHMTPLSGIGMTHLVRKGEKQGVDRHLPIVMVTGENDASIIRSAMSAGITDLLPKPCPPKTLQDRVRRAITTEFQFVEVDCADGKTFYGPLTPFARKHVLPGRPHRVERVSRRVAG
jgi:CheY-like chemotaxis protein